MHKEMLRIIPLQVIIDFRSDQQDADADIQPQHHDHDGGQAPIHVGVVAEIAEIDGKQVGENNPSHRAEEGSRHLASQGMLSHRHVGIQPCKDDDQKPQSHQRPQTDEIAGKTGDHGQPFDDEALDGGPKHQHQQAADAGDDKQDGITGADKPADNVSPFLRAFINTVQPPFDAKHSPRRRPQSGDRGDGDDGSRRFCV